MNILVVFAGILDRQNLGVLYAGPGVIAAADDLSIANNHRAYGRIGRSLADAQLG